MSRLWFPEKKVFNGCWNIWNSDRSPAFRKHRFCQTFTIKTNKTAVVLIVLVWGFSCLCTTDVSQWEDESSGHQKDQTRYLILSCSPTSFFSLLCSSFFLLSCCCLFFFSGIVSHQLIINVFVVIYVWMRTVFVWQLVLKEFCVLIFERWQHREQHNDTNNTFPMKNCWVICKTSIFMKSKMRLVHGVFLVWHSTHESCDIQFYYSSDVSF